MDVNNWGSCPKKTKCKEKMMQGMLVESIFHGEPW
jgi:hypothetical protein